MAGRSNEKLARQVWSRMFDFLMRTAPERNPKSRPPGAHAQRCPGPVEPGPRRRPLHAGAGRAVGMRCLQRDLDRGSPRALRAGGTAAGSGGPAGEAGRAHAGGGAAPGGAAGGVPHSPDRPAPTEPEGSGGPGPRSWTSCSPRILCGFLHAASAPPRARGGRSSPITGYLLTRKQLAPSNPVRGRGARGLPSGRRERRHRRLHPRSPVPPTTGRNRWLAHPNSSFPCWLLASSPPAVARRSRTLLRRLPR